MVEDHPVKMTVIGSSPIPVAFKDCIMARTYKKKAKPTQEWILRNEDKVLETLRYCRGLTEKMKDALGIGDGTWSEFLKEHPEWNDKVQDIKHKVVEDVEDLLHDCMFDKKDRVKAITFFLERKGKYDKNVNVTNMNVDVKLPDFLGGAAEEVKEDSE